MHLEPWRWEPETGTLSHAERIGGRIGTVAVRQLDPTTLAVAWDGFADGDGAGNPAPGRRAGCRPNGTRAPAIAALGAGFADEAALIARGRRAAAARLDLLRGFHQDDR